jgi:hypothetical protein
MLKDVSVRARWDDEAKVWTATSADIQGLVIEADTLPEVFHEIALVLPDLLELNLSKTFHQD